MPRKSPQGPLWIKGGLNRRTANMFNEFAHYAEAMRFTGGIAIATAEGREHPVVSVEGRFARNKHEAAGALLYAAILLASGEL
jgi:hypothetical protein